MTTTIGQPLDRIDGRLKVTGAARYSAEFALPGMVHAVLVQSTIANGRVASMDDSAARAAPGVLYVMTPFNAPKLKATEKKRQAKEPQEYVGAQALPDGTDFPLLQDTRVKYNGQHVGLVVAATFEQATHAANLIRVRYAEEKPSLAFDARQKRDAPKRFRNGARPPDSRRGDPEAALAAAGVRVDETYATPIEHHNPMEPHATVAAWDGDRLTLFNATQAVHQTRKIVATLLGTPPEKVHVVTQFVGGGFGCKGNTWPHVTLAAMAAKAVGRPVKLVLTRRQMFTANGFRPETLQRVALGADRQGKLTATIHDGVTQSSFAGEFAEPVGLAAEMLYSCPNVGVSHRLVVLNSGVPTYMRAPGEATGVFALESAMDELAYKLGIDPLELRLRNYAKMDEREQKPWSSKSLDQCYRQAADSFGWSRRNPEPGSMRQGRSFIGWGMATATYPGNRSPAAARVRLMPDGTAIVESGTQDIGTGTYTILAQVAADALGLPVERITVRIGDSDFPEAPVSGGSQTIASVAPAVREAAEQAKRKLAEQVGGRPGEALPQMLARAGQPVDALVQAKPGEEKKRASVHSFGAHFVEVRVDPDLGTVRVARYVGAFAAGHAMNAKTARSQMLGGIVYGLGMALLEETRMDRRNGRIVSASLADYLVPVHADVPDIEVILVDEADSAINELGAKGMGELPMVGVAPAVANAVFHATGKRIRELPLTIDKLMA
jgi:xanthine dehydrogenase YagR molybdenum-binding subunit